MISLLYMTKEYRNWSVIDIENKNGKLSIHNLPYTQNYYFDIFEEIANKGVKANYIIFISPNWMRNYHGTETAIFTLNKNFRVIYTSNFFDIKKILEETKYSIVRGNYKEWNEIISHLRSPWAFLPCYGKIEPKNLKFSLKSDTTVLIDDREFIAKFEGFRTEIFKKPATKIYHEPIPQVEKDLDVIFICSKTDRPHKRFDLFLESLPLLDEIIVNKITVGIVGNSSFHQAKIDSLSLKNIDLKLIGGNDRVNRFEVRSTLDRAKLTVCTSNTDANPRVISESLSRNVPVLCATDLTGGKFQINDKTGMLFEPNPTDLAKAINLALSRIDQFQAKSGAYTISESADQIIHLMKNK